MGNTYAPSRVHIYSDDLGDVCVFLMRLDDLTFEEVLSLSSGHAPLIDVRTGTDCSIRELAATIGDIIGLRGSPRFDTSKPDGTPSQLPNVDRMSPLGWQPKTPLRDPTIM